MQHIKEIIERMRRMTVVRAPGTDETPMIKIANQLLKAAGFGIGTPVEVAYGPGIITVKIINHANHLQTPQRPVAHSAASVQADARKGVGYSRYGKSSPTDVTKAVPVPVLPLGYVFAGSGGNGNSQDPWPGRC